MYVVICWAVWDSAMLRCVEMIAMTNFVNLSRDLCVNVHVGMSDAEGFGAVQGAVTNLLAWRDNCWQRLTLTAFQYQAARCKILSCSQQYLGLTDRLFIIISQVTLAVTSGDVSTTFLSPYNIRVPCGPTLIMAKVTRWVFRIGINAMWTSLQVKLCVCAFKLTRDQGRTKHARHSQPNHQLAEWANHEPRNDLNSPGHY